MKTTIFANVLRYSVPSLALVAALGASGCMQDASTSPYRGNIIAEVRVSESTRLVFVDEGDDNVGVAEISSAGKASIIMDMFQREHASPLEIYLASTGAELGEDTPETLVANHHEIALQQGREDLEPRRVALRPDDLASPGITPAADWYTYGATPCTAAGWEGPSGAWGDPVDWWAIIFTNSTQVYTNNTTYPTVQSTKQLPAWNGGSGSFHSHGACLGAEAGQDQTVTFTVRLSNLVDPVFEWDISALPEDEASYVIYNDYVNTNFRTMKSEITNAGNASATFRHSAAAWVPLPQ